MHWTWCALHILTWKCASHHNGFHFLDIWTSKSARNPVCFVHCASRHNGVDFFDISTSKSAPRLRCFVHFDFETCFAPQQRRLFEHLNCQKCTEWGVLCTFWLRSVLHATTTACPFSTSQLPKVLRTCGAFSFFTCKCASRHNGVQFVISRLPDGSAPAALASLLFDPPEPQIMRLFYPSPHLHLLSSDSFSSLIFSLLLFSDPSHLCFSICPCCRKFDFWTSFENYISNISISIIVYPLFIHYPLVS